MVKGGAYAGTGVVGGVADDVVTLGAADVDDDDAATSSLLLIGEHLLGLVWE